MCISIEELLNIDNSVIIDIRNSYYYDMGHIEGAISIPYYNLFSNYSYYLDKSDTYYLYCDTGDKSYDMAHYLNNLGYRVFSVDGGYLLYCRLKKKA